MTGLHAIHVVVGMSVLSALAIAVARGRVNATNEHPIALGAAYWHLVDLIWIFLWPMFYLMHGG
jgi:cytochrome c oxidase subunit 3